MKGAREFKRCLKEININFLLILTPALPFKEHDPMVPLEAKSTQHFSGSDFISASNLSHIVLTDKAALQRQAFFFAKSSLCVLKLKNENVQDGRSA